jgi:hypothetical protein
MSSEVCVEVVMINVPEEIPKVSTALSICYHVLTVTQPLNATQ